MKAMLLEGLTPAWQSLHRRLRAQCRVVIAHESPAIQDELATELARSEITVERVGVDDRAQRWRDGDYAIAITDSQTPGEPGHGGRDWFVVSDDDRDAPLLLEAGATDVAFDLATQRVALVRRVLACVSDRTAMRVLDIVIGDMVSALQENQLESELLDWISGRLLAHRAGVLSRPPIVLCDSDADRLAEAMGDYEDRLTTVDFRTARPQTVLRTLRTGNAPLVVMLAARARGASDLAHQIAKTSPEIEVMMCAERSPGHEPAATWSDWSVNGIDAPEVVAARSLRLWRRARRRLLYQGLLAVLTDAMTTRPKRRTTAGDSAYIGPREDRDSFTVSGAIPIANAKLRENG